MKRRRLSGAGRSSAHLLDTSTLLWALGAPERLSRRVQNLADLPTWWRRATELLAGRTLSIRASHVTALAALPMLHKDPFDRILVAQAVAEGLDFLTGDEHIIPYPVRTIW